MQRKGQFTGIEEMVVSSSREVKNELASTKFQKRFFIKIELLLTVLSKFEQEAAFKDSVL